MSKYSIETSIIIQASVETVWNALTDFSNYDQWNSLIPSASGSLSQGSYLQIWIQVQPPEKQLFKVQLLEVIPNSRLEWLGHFKLPGLVDGHHVHELRQISPNETLFIQKESFRGLLVPFVWRAYLNSKVRNGLMRSNEDLKNYIQNGTRL